jgi:hypothetical protein
MSWHSVDDMMPPFDTDVLLFDGKSMCVGQLYEEGGWAMYKPTLRVITHWQWLPPAPRK